MARKGSLIGSMKAAADQVVPEKGRGLAERPAGPTVTTAIHVPKATLTLLRRVSIARADHAGGRPSVSAVLTDLVERSRAELEREAATEG